MTAAASLIDDLERSLETGTSEQRQKALLRVTDLFVVGANRYTEEQIGLFDEVIGKLAADIEAKARAKVAHRLASLANAPRKVIRSLAFDDDFGVAEPVLTQSPRLEEADLIVNASTKSQQHLNAIARRHLLSEAVTDVLVSRGDKQVVHTVARDSGARFSDAGFRMLVKRSTGDDVLAAQVGSRPDLPRQHFFKILDMASAAVRRRLAAENFAARGAVDGVLEEVVGAISSRSRNASTDYTAAKVLVEKLFGEGRLGEREVHGFARERKFEETAVALSLLCQVEISVVERALLDPGHEMLLILSKIAGLSSTTAKAILLLRAADRGMSAQDLDQALTTFGRLNVGTARCVLDFYKTRRRDPLQAIEMATAAQACPPAIAQRPPKFEITDLRAIAARLKSFARVPYGRRRPHSGRDRTGRASAGHP